MLEISWMLFPSTRTTDFSFSNSSFLLLGRTLTATLTELLKLGCSVLIFFSLFKSTFKPLLGNNEETLFWDFNSDIFVFDAGVVVL